MLRIMLVNAFPRVLSLSLVPLSLYLLSSSFRLSKSGQRAVVPYFASTPILSLGLILSCGSVSALIALGSEPPFATQLFLVDSLILSLVSHIITFGVEGLLFPVIMNKLNGSSATNLYHATYTNSLVAVTAASCATELSSLVIDHDELSTLASPILCTLSSFGPIPLLVLLFISPRTVDSTLGSKRMHSLLTQLGLLQLLGCISSALKVIKPTIWVLFSIRMLLLVQTVLSMLIYHVLNKFRVGRPSSVVPFKLRPPFQPTDSIGDQDYNLSHVVLPFQRPRTHQSQKSLPKPIDETGWKWSGPPQRLLVLEPVHMSSTSTAGERASFNDITKKPEIDPFSPTRPNSYGDETTLQVDPQSPSLLCINPEHEPVIQPELQEVTPRTSEVHDVDR